LGGRFRCLQIASDLSNGYEYARTLTLTGWGTWNSMSGGGGGSGTLHGTGAPSNGAGADGDFYIDTSSWTVYGPKASGAWPGGASMVGPQGSQGIQGIQGIQGNTGTAGKTMLNGSGAPSNGVGTDGDFYFDTTNVAIYGPKAAGAWPGSAFGLLLQLNAANQAWTGGVIVTEYDYTTKSSGTLDINPGLRPTAIVTNNGSFEIIMTNKGAQDLIVTNGASAGNITFTGFSRQLQGDSLTTTVGHKFLITFMKIGTTSLYQIVALQ
jgi:hypothetical protein